MTMLPCATCRAIRRFLMAFVVGGMTAWQMGINIPYANTVESWRLIVLVVLMFSVASVLMRLRQLRRNWRR